MLSGAFLHSARFFAHCKPNTRRTVELSRSIRTQLAGTEFAQVIRMIAMILIQVIIIKLAVWAIVQIKPVYRAITGEE